MRTRKTSSLALVASFAAPLLCAGFARGSDIDILPDACLNMEAARYVPSKIDQRLVGTIGGRTGLVRFGSTTFFLDAHIETILGTERRPFDADQGSYHIELGFDQRLRDLRLIPFFHHVSRHELDRSKPEAVDWNVLGVRVDGPWPRATRPRLRAGFGIGHTTLASLVGYRWELTANADALPLPRGSTELHIRARARLVTTEHRELFPRNGFLDYALELAARWTRARRSFEAFVALEHRNDVLLTIPDTRTRLLLGVRFGLEDDGRHEAAGGPATAPGSPQGRR
jgi:hypothetical protein